ncbi:MAG TPA: hypothetical protein VKB51_08565 [bacterium]|nr:hypothetical protein [bacterium]
MKEDHYIGVLDPRILEYVKFSRFHWWEIGAIAVVLGALLGYALLAVVLDRRARARRRKHKQLSRLEAWLDAWRLEPDEEEALWELAGQRKPLALYALLAEPLRFERAVHEALISGKHLPFTERVRDALGYRSDNLSCPVVSTRQLMVGDHLRFAVWEEGRPQHHYAIVTAVSAAGLAVELTEAGFRDVTSARGETELFFLRGNDLEVRFPLAVRTADAERHRLLLAHQLVRGGQRPRSTRLPMLRPITFRLRAQAAELASPHALATGELAAGQPGGAQGQEMRGALLEMSEGGFSMVTLHPVAEGAYVEHAMQLPRGRYLPIVGRVLDCRAFAGNRWLVRCELRGLTPTQRNTLSQVLRLEQARRLRAIQAERRKRLRESGEAP